MLAFVVKTVLLKEYVLVFIDPTVDADSPFDPLPKSLGSFPSSESASKPLPTPSLPE
jgi:hypothetical protein